MRREDFEHVIAAAANVSGEYEIVVIGSQAILGTHPDAPEELLTSIEVDLYPRSHPEKADEIDGVLGDGSLFHGTYGYYAHGVGPETATAPAGWEDRLVRVEITPRVGQAQAPIAYCMELTDLVLAKCAAGRDRDWEFAKVAFHHGLVNPDDLLRRIPDLPIPASDQGRIRKMLRGIIERGDR